MDRNQSGDRKKCKELNNAGFSLMEVLVTIAILGIIGGIFIGFVQSGSRSYQSTNQEVDIQYDAQVLLNQIESYVMDANSGFKQTADEDHSVTHIYNNNGNALETERLSWEKETETLSYEKTETRDNKTTSLVEETILAENVSEFSLDISRADTERKVEAGLSLNRDGKNYQANVTWNLRNANAADTASEDNTDESGESSTVSSVEVSASETQLWPGEEQLFYARVQGEHNPSQKVVWFINGEVTSSDTYIDNGGILHVGENETAAEIQVSAQSSQDPTVTGTLNVQIHNEKIRIEPEEVWLGITGGYADPDSYGNNQVELSAQLLGDHSGELKNITWICDRDAHQKDMAQQEEELKKTITLDSKEKYGKMTVQATAQDADGNTVTSNQAVIHVVTIDSNVTWKGKSGKLSAEHTTRLYIYGLEDVPKEEIYMARSFDMIQNNTEHVRFYIYESREVLWFNNQIGFVKNGDDSWGCNVWFYPKFSIWDYLFPDPLSEYTCVGIYKAGEVNPKTDESGDVQKFGFAALKIGLAK